jgi:hypothetical protein
VRSTRVLGAAVLVAALASWFRDSTREPIPTQILKPIPTTDEVQDLRQEVAALRKERDGLQEEVLALRVELAEREEQHTRRELEWLEFTRALSRLEVPDIVATPAQPAFLFEPEPAPPLDPAARSAAAADDAAADRAARARLDLNALLIAEHVFALDFFEIGRVNDGWAGPVVVRELDDRGRMVGTLAADRLRLEASRAGRSVTLVFEVGWESRGGVRAPFGPPEKEGGERGGTRRIQLPGVAPAPWIEALPELLRPEDLRTTPDDGRWNLVELRLLLDERLRLDSPAGRWRLIAVGGVVGGDMLDVHLAEIGSTRRVERRMFADTLRVRRRGAGLELTLFNGVIERDGEKAPFLEGRYRLYLPDADPEVWKAVGVPGLSGPPR